jgi:D-alanyl-D-alanine carboxypeptidase
MFGNQNFGVLFFALAVLAAAAFGGIKQEKDVKSVLQSEITQTSLVAASVSAPAEFIALKSFNESLPVSPAIPAPVIFAKDLTNSRVFLEKNSGKRWAMASLTKLMTAVIAKEQIGSDKMLTVSGKAVGTEGINGGFEVGERASVETLIRAMLAVSSNDAASAAAEFLGENKFISAMRAKAAELGMTQTIFSDPSGLSSLNQSTAVDLEKLVRYILEHHLEFFEITRLKQTEINGRTLNNINQFAGRPDFLGGKTGFTDEAGGNLISIFDYQRHRILIIVLGADDRFLETEKILNWIKEVL